MSADKFIAVAKKYEELSDQLDTLRSEMLLLMKEIGPDTYHQDWETKAVYKIVKPTGTFIHFRELDYVRTSLEGEKRGSLSKKEAEEKGFDLKK